MKSKIILLSLVISVLAISTLSAQTDTTKKSSNAVASENFIPKSEFRTVRLGIYGGLGVSWMKPKTVGYTSEGSRIAYSYGLLVDYNFTENYTFTSGISYSSLGGKLLYNDSAIVTQNLYTQGTTSRSYRINYLEIPTLLKLKTNQMGYFTYFAQIGLRHGFRLNSIGTDEFKFTNGSKEPVTDINIVDNVSFYRMSFNIGLGAEYAISQTFSAFTFLEFDNGLTNALTNPNKSKENKEQAFLKKFGLTVGFLF